VRAAHFAQLKIMFDYSKKVFSPKSFFMGALIAIVFMGGTFYGISFLSKNSEKKTTGEERAGSLIVKTANAAEIYPEFVCPCCGQPLDKNNICCGSAGQMIDFIDKQVQAGLSKDEIILAAAKEFGMDSFFRPELRQEILQKLAASAPADAPKIIFEKNSFDFGDVRQSKGVTFTTFNFKNEGKTDLVINKIATSCGCTSGSVIYQGKEGPVFTMPGHGAENPIDWQIAIAPGDTAELKVYYDPNTHKDLQGPVTRTVTVFSNDLVNFETTVKIELNQIP
jgi:hypothetical protein